MNIFLKAVANAEFGENNLFPGSWLKVWNQESRRGYMRGKGPKETTPRVDVCHLTVNIHSLYYKTQASHSPMSSPPNNVLHVSPSATFFLFPPLFLRPFSSSLHPLISPTLCDCGMLMGHSQRLRKPVLLLNWCLGGWCTRGTQTFDMPALQ